MGLREETVKVLARRMSLLPQAAKGSVNKCFERENIWVIKALLGSCCVGLWWFDFSP